jgi:hypothetical protein
VQENLRLTAISISDWYATLKDKPVDEVTHSGQTSASILRRAFVAMQYFGYLRRDPDTIGYNN